MNTPAESVKCWEFSLSSEIISFIIRRISANWEGEHGVTPKTITYMENTNNFGRSETCIASHRWVAGTWLDLVTGQKKSVGQPIIYHSGA